MDARALIHELSARHRLHAAGFARVGPTPGGERLQPWLDRGMHGELEWMTRQVEVRLDPRARLPSARTAVVFRVDHHHRRPPDPGGLTGSVARYAWGRDYHNLVGKRLRKLRRDLREAGVESWGGVDTAPILERAWAREAGVGFSGKHTGQVLTGRSSWFFLAVLFVDAQVEPTPPVADGCGRCARCLAACPSGALLSAWRLDARRCLSTWTIEAAGLPPRHLRPDLGRRFFGCDACQEACPHNHAPPDPDEDDLLSRSAWIHLPEVLRSEDGALVERFTGTPLRRPGGVGLKRNAALCLGNIPDTGGVPALRHALEHPSPVVRGAAVWALARLGSSAAADHRDEDPVVGEEVRAARLGEVPPCS